MLATCYLPRATMMIMDLNEYQKKAHTTALPVKVEGSLAYPVLGLAGEIGELINKFKKIYRDDSGTITEAKKAEILEELGDVLWYVSEIATSFNASLEKVAEINIEKLEIGRAHV